MNSLPHLFIYLILKTESNVRTDLKKTIKATLATLLALLQSFERPQILTFDSLIFFPQRHFNGAASLVTELTVLSRSSLL